MSWSSPKSRGRTSQYGGRWNHWTPLHLERESFTAGCDLCYRVSECVCVWLEGVFLYICTSKGWRICSYTSLGASLNLYFHSFHNPYLQGCDHLYSQMCVCTSEADRLPFFFLLLHTSKASDGWISRCSGVNLSCLQLSVLKEPVEEAVCPAVIVAYSFSHLLVFFNSTQLPVISEFLQLSPSCSRCSLVKRLVTRYTCRHKKTFKD